MIKEFEENVKKLFHTIITEQDAQEHTASELLDLLECKVTLPVTSTWDGDYLKLVYYNVSLDINDDLASMTVSYNSDYTVQMQQLGHCNLYQLADYVLALERDIPRWKHIWMAENKLRKERARIDKLRKMTLREIRRTWTAGEGSVSEDVEQVCRIRFYNVKALDLMLKNDYPFWENKKTEAEILDQCHIYHLAPPMEQWYEEWTEFVHDCEREKTELERRREEYKNKLMKMRHLINIKYLKINALINTVELHPSFTVSVIKSFDENKLAGTKYGSFLISFFINGVNVSYAIKYDAMDACIGKTIECVKRINDLMPKLQQTLLKDSERHFVQVGLEYGMYGYFHSPVKNPLRIIERTNAYSKPILFTNLDSCRIIDRINSILNDCSTN